MFIILDSKTFGMGERVCKNAAMTLAEIRRLLFFIVIKIYFLEDSIGWSSVQMV